MPVQFSLVTSLCKIVSGGLAADVATSLQIEGRSIAAGCDSCRHVLTDTDRPWYVAHCVGTYAEVGRHIGWLAASSASQYAVHIRRRSPVVARGRTRR